MYIFSFSFAPFPNSFMCVFGVQKCTVLWPIVKAALVYKHFPKGDGGQNSGRLKPTLGSNQH